MEREDEQDDGDDFVLENQAQSLQVQGAMKDEILALGVTEPTYRPDLSKRPGHPEHPEELRTLGLDPPHQARA